MTLATSLSGIRAVPTTTRSEMAGGDSFESVTRRVRNEYLEMPGLSLTLRQAQRMWHLRQTECETLLGALVDSGFLARTSKGEFVLAGSGKAGA